MSATPDVSLSALQAWMHRHIAAPSTPLHFAANPLQSTSTLNADARLAIYQRSYRLRLLQSFHALFPGLKHALGDDLLDAFALDYLAAHPPRHTSIHRIADRFIEHLEGTRPPSDESSGWVDFLIDLARTELALLEVSEARGLEGTAAPSPHYWRDLDTPTLWRSRPALAPCVRLLRLTHAAHEYLQALRRDESPGPPATRPICLALTRVDYRLATRDIAPVQWELLRRLDGATSLRDIVHTLTSLPLRPLPTTELLPLWLDNFTAQGLIQY